MQHFITLLGCILLLVIPMNLCCPFDPKHFVSNSTNSYTGLSNVNCDLYHRYAHPAGVCNSQSDPLIGASSTPFIRIVPAVLDYESRQSPLITANKIMKARPFSLSTDQQLSYMGIFYGQYIARDVSFLQTLRTETAASRIYKLPLDPGNVAIPLDIGGHSSEIPNYTTHYMDHSNIYGYTPKLLDELRLFRGGEMKLSANGILPQNEQGNYITADSRAFLFPTIAMLNSLFLRLHNQIAGDLVATNPHWTDEIAFQQTRRLTTAIHQSITYKEWLPLAIGHDYGPVSRLAVFNANAEDNSHVDGRISLEFLTALRSMHAIVPLFAHLYDNNHECIESVRIDNNPMYTIDNLEMSFTDVLRGMIADSGVYTKFPGFMRNVTSLSGHHFDVLNFDIMTNRAYNLAPYTTYFELCLGRPVLNWDDFQPVISRQGIAMLRHLYTRIEDIDLSVALLLEVKRSAVMGSVGQCLLAEQMYRTMHGDRFFYSVSNAAYPFTVPQLQSIESLTFADVLCWITDVDEVQAKVLQPPSAANPLAACSGRTIDMRFWRHHRDTMNPVFF